MNKTVNNYNEQAITKKDTDLEATVALMAKIGSCGSPSFSPDGTRLAFVSDMSGVPQVWTVATQGGWPQLVTALDDQVSSVEWSPDGKWLACVVAPGGGMNSQIYLVRPDGSELHSVTDGGKENNWLGLWSADSQKLGISSSRRRPDSMDNYLLDVTTGEFELILENLGTGRVTDVSKDGRLVIVMRVENRSDNNLILIDRETKREFLLTPHTPPGNFFKGSFSPDGSTVYLTSNQNLDLVVLAKIELAQDKTPGSIEILVTRDDAELYNFQVSEDGKVAVLLWNVAGRNELAFLDLATQELTAGPKLPAEIAAELTFSQDASYLAMTLTDATSPNDIWILDRNTGKFWQVTFSPHAGINLDKLVQPELVRFPAHDGLELSGWLYRPHNFVAPGPLVLSFHGGPEGQERPAFSSVYQALLAQGIAVFAPNVRGSSGFGKKFGNLDNGSLRFNAVKDIKACADYAVNIGVADPKRIGIMGGSYGGYMTMAGLTQYPETFAAGANLYGIVNFETFFAQTEPWMAAVSKIKYGDPETQAEMLHQLSPIHTIERVKAPTLVLHGANDTNVPVVEAEQVVANLKERGVPVEYVLFPDEGHGFRKTHNRIRATVSIVSWFKRYL